MTHNYFVSFVGANDAGTLEGPDEGAILTVLRSRKFDRIHLLFNEGKTTKGTPYQEIVEHVVEQIMEGGIIPKKNIRIDKVVFGDIADHVDVYQRLRAFLVDAYPPSLLERSKITVGISSGTPAMQTAWILLAESGAFHAKLVRSVRREHAIDGQRVVDVQLQTGILPKIERLKALESAFAGNEQSDYAVVYDPTTLTEAQKIVARRSEPVLIIGETGVGKEELAKSIHASSGRSGRLVDINCGGVPESLMESELFGHARGAFTGSVGAKRGLVEEADSGTLFLDEINSMPAALQAKVLRFLGSGTFRRLGDTTDRRVNVRVIAAGNKPLLRLVHEGLFREDLYYRLCAFEFFIPPLRERKGKLRELAQEFLNAASGGSSTFSEDGLKTLEQYEFRGNIRELRIVASRLAITCAGKTVVGAADVSTVIGRLGLGPSTAVQIPEILHGKVLELVEDVLFKAALLKGDFTNAKAAAILGVSAPTVAERRKKLPKQK